MRRLLRHQAPPLQAVHGPKLAVLFWFYDHLEVCSNRLALLRRLNPGHRIYGLYGGPLEHADRFSRALQLDHFYAFPLDWTPLEKWRNGDLMITRWFRDAGAALEWDTIIVAQWDMLILEPIVKLFGGLKRDELYLSSIQPVRNIESRWFWTARSNPVERRRYEEFVDHVGRLTPEPPEILASLFVVVCLPRLFLARYSRVERPELGFLEYRVPTYAKLFGVPVATGLGFDASHPDIPETFRGQQRFLQPVGSAIPLLDIYLERCRPGGAAIFHPYARAFHSDVFGLLRGLGDAARDLPRSVAFRMGGRTWFAGLPGWLGRLGRITRPR